MDLRRAVVRAVILGGAYAVLGLELLSLSSSVNPVTLVLMWAVPASVFAWLLIKKRERWRVRRWILVLPEGRGERGALLVLAVIMTITGITAALAPPNTYDSLTYHMSRVAHWAQDGGVQSFATGNLRQNYMSPGAEMMVLQTYILAQGDRWANAIQWLAMVISVIGVSLVAADLGASRRGQLFAALFAASLPMGIAQASSTMTDYITAMWVLLASSEVLCFWKGDHGWVSLPLAAGAAGLSILSKPTGGLFILPFALWTILVLFHRYSLKTVLGWGLAASLIVLVLNLGYFIRNGVVFGSFLGGGAQLDRFTNEIFNGRVVLSNLLRNASLQAGTPWPWWNDNLYLLLAKVHWKINLGLTDARTSIHPFFTIWPYPADEARATNTIQSFMILLAVGLGFVKRAKVSRADLYFGFSCLTGFLLFSSVLKFDLLGSRYHMPFFVLIAPAVAVVLSKSMRASLLTIASILLIVGAVPLLFSLESRTLIPNEDGDSVFTTRRLDQYFMQAPNVDEPYIEMTSLIGKNKCSDIGLMLRGDSPEYPLWVLLGAPDKSLRMEWIIRETDVSGSFRDPDFLPCAVVCETCGQSEDGYNDLSLTYDKYGYRLYQRP